MVLARFARHRLTCFGYAVRGVRLDGLFRELVERETWLADRWAAYQDEAVRHLVRHAFETVPHYRNVLTSAGLGPADIGSASDLRKLPKLSKPQVRAAGRALLSQAYDPSSLEAIHTSGSTGIPLSLFGDKARRASIVAGLWRIYARSGWQPGEPIASIWGLKPADRARHAAWHFAKDLVSGVTHLDAFQANDQEYRRWVSVLRQRRPTVLVCYASSGARFARWLLDKGERIDSIRGVYSTSETLLAPQREELSRAFGATVYDLYGCGEVTHIACSCPVGNLHINPDMAIVEVDGDRDAAGDARPFLLTGFANRAMPFLRYANGDRGRLRAGACSCGRQTPLLDLEIARVADVFTFGNGKQYPSLYFILRLYRAGFDGVELFQFHQTALDRIRLKVVRNERFDAATAAELDRVVEEIQDHVERQAIVELEYVDAIELGGSGKHFYAKSDVRPAAP